MARRDRDAVLGTRKCFGPGWLVPAIFLLSLLFAAAPARAIQLKTVTCTAGGSSAGALLALAPDQLDCSPDRFDLSQKFVRGRVDVAKLRGLPPGQLVWQTDPGSFDSMLIRLTYADGSARIIDVDQAMISRNWDANGNFWVSIAPASSTLATMDVVVERPQSMAVLRRMAVASFAESAQDSATRTLFFTFVIGLLCVPMVYDLFFYRVLREKFMAWHLVMAVGTVLYVLLNSGIVLLLTPDLGPLARFALTFVAAAAILLGAAQFSCRVLERGCGPPGLARGLKVLTGATVVIGAAIALDWEPLRLKLPFLFALVALASLLGIGLLIVHGLVHASRASRYLAVAYSGVVAAGLVQVAVILDLVEQSDTLDDWIYLGLIVLVLGTAGGVVDRFLVIKGERDRARITARRLGLLATSDGLTGLLNRRAFDRIRRLPPGRGLILADLDRFKAVNDTFGHPTGDAMLCQVGRVLAGVLAEHGDGEVFRLGGEEFAIVCDVETASDLHHLAEELRGAVAGGGAHGAAMGELPPVTTSIGCVLGDGQLMHIAVAAADDALYRAKIEGRDRIVIFADAA